MSKAASSAPPSPDDRRAGASEGRAKPRPATKASRPARSPEHPRPATLGREALSLAQQRAATILEVLAGEQTVGEAARLLGISVMRYYLLERRALQGRTRVGLGPGRGPERRRPCAPRPPGNLQHAARPGLPHAAAHRSRREAQASVARRTGAPRRQVPRADATRGRASHRGPDFRAAAHRIAAHGIAAHGSTGRGDAGRGDAGRGNIGRTGFAHQTAGRPDARPGTAGRRKLYATAISRVRLGTHAGFRREPAGGVGLE